MQLQFGLPTTRARGNLVERASDRIDDYEWNFSGGPGTAA